jgi:predicted phage terminase large subunit-like protein
MNLSQTEFDVLLRHDLATFTARAFAHLDPQTPYLPNWHIELIAHYLMKVARGEITRLIINVPPRSLKSILASVAFVAWLLGRYPGLRVICASYGQELATKHASDCLSLMQSDWYQRAFGTRLTSLRPAVADFYTTQRGGRMATSVGGVLTGRGGDVLIIDDPVKPDEAMSESQRNAANEWFDNTLYTRLNDKTTGAIILIMQRLHLADMVGHVSAKENWEVLHLPAIAEADETWTYATAFGPVVHQRAVGTALHPARESIATLDLLRQILGEYTFSAQYLQQPVPMGGGVVRADWLHYYGPEALPHTFDTIVQSWDTANKETQLSDHSVCTTWGVKDKHIFLLHVLRKRLQYPDLKRAVHDQARFWSPTIILIEDKASGTQLVQELSREGLSQVKDVKPEGDKVMRMAAQTAMIENGFVHLPIEAPWLASYVQELTTFPKAKYDDQVDSTSQALKWIFDSSAEPGILTWMRQELAERWGVSEEEVKRRLQ